MPQLRAADFTIVIDAGSAIVAARYEFEPAVDTLTFNVIKLREQRLQLLPGGDQDAGFIVAELSGLYSITVERGMEHIQRVQLAYQVTGQIPRIPLPVPNVPPQPGTASVRITLTGVAEEASLRDGFPRLTREPDGSAQAQLDNLPGFIRLPPNRNTWNTNRLADGAVMLLVLAGTLYWLYRRRSRAVVAVGQ